MDDWGQNMKRGSFAVSEMISRGFGMEPDFLYKLHAKGNKHLAPTAVNLKKRKVGDVLAAFHRDFDLLTVHGKSKFPGLFAWLSTGEKFLVKVPEGHLLLQAGKQLEWVTGG